MDLEHKIFTLGFLGIGIVLTFSIITFGFTRGFNLKSIKIPDKFSGYMPASYDLSKHDSYGPARVLQVLKTHRKILKYNPESITTAKRNFVWTFCCVCKQKTREDLSYFQRINYVFVVGKLPKEFHYNSLVNYLADFHVYGTCSKECTRLLYFAITP